MITDYALVYGKTPAKLGAEVNRLIGEGWQPFGAPFLAEPAVVVQAMVKYAQPAPVGKLPPPSGGIGE